MSFEKLFKNRRVLIVGDVMIDRYWHGLVTRISPEAPVPVVNFLKKEDRLGGAGNVALNILAFGSEPMLASVIGENDETAAWDFLFSEKKLHLDGILRSKTRKSTVKTRILSNYQQMLRLDQEDTHELSEDESAAFLKKIERIFSEKKPEIVIFQDYNKGVLSAKIIAEVLSLSKKNNVPTVVDPKRANFFEYRGATLFKPNLKEIREATGLKINANLTDLDAAAAFLRKKIGHAKTMFTLSELGIYTEMSGIGSISPTEPRKIADVCGAGDTVIAVAALGLLAGMNLPDLARLCNHAGGQVCETAGVVSVDAARLFASFLE
jgi:D-glycero-beta-D-manno-heptose-7-phosphate kinase